MASPSSPNDSAHVYSYDSDVEPEGGGAPLPPSASFTVKYQTASRVSAGEDEDKQQSNDHFFDDDTSLDDAPPSAASVQAADVNVALVDDEKDEHVQQEHPALIDNQMKEDIASLAAETVDLVDPDASTPDTDEYVANPLYGVDEQPQVFSYDQDGEAEAENVTEEQEQEPPVQFIINAELSPSPVAAMSSSTASHSHRPSFMCLSPNDVANRSLFSPPSRRQSFLAAEKESKIAPEYEREISEMLSLSVHETSAIWPYSLADKSQVESAPVMFPMVAEDPLVPTNDPTWGIASPANNDDKPPSLPDTIDLVYDTPTRYTQPVRRADFSQAESMIGRGSVQAQYAIKGNREKLLFVSLYNESKGLDSGVSDQINAFPNIETVQIQQCKIKKSFQLKCKNLLNLDARNNKIKDVEIVQNMVLNSPNLYSLTLTGNPIAEKWNPLPPLDHAIWKNVILRLPNLEYINLHPIDNDSRQRAWAVSRSKKLYPLVSSALWFTALNNAPAILNMPRWNASQITELDLSGQSLMALHLAALTSLVSLNASNNQLTTLVGSGIHHCKQLQVINLSNNKLKDVNEVYYLAPLQYLRSISLAGNEMRDYLSILLYATRGARGSNRLPGLQEVDGYSVTMESKILAVHAISKSKTAAQRERWRLNLIEHFGHDQLSKYSHIFKRLHILTRELTFADVSTFTSLVSLQLAHNKLKIVEGLEFCVNLQYVDLSDNPTLNRSATIAQLSKLTKLENVSIARTQAEANDKSDLLFLLCALYPSNPCISILELHALTPQQYIVAFRHLNKLKNDDPAVVQYKLNLSIIMNNTPREGRNYSANACVLGNGQLSREQVVMLDLSNQNLGDSIQFPSLPNLKILNLSFNAIVNLPADIHKLYPRLQYLDIRSNKFKLTIPFVSSLILSFPELVGIALAGNSNVSPKFRAGVLKSLPILSDLSCPLRVIDTAIQIEERVACWGFVPGKQRASIDQTDSDTTASPGKDAKADAKLAAAKQKQKEETDKSVFRFQLALQQQCLPNIENQAMEELNLMNLQLNMIDMTPFISLKKLLLSRNQLTNLSHSGISTLKQLTVLDCHSNRLSDLQDVLSVLNSLPKLVYISFFNNRFPNPNKYRTLLIGGITMLQDHERCLKFLDNQLITDDEIVKGLAELGKTPEEHEIWLFNQVTVHVPRDVVALDLSNKKLKRGAFESFTNLRKLDLQNNYFTDEALFTSKLVALTNLEQLNISGNLLQDHKHIASVVSKLPRLTHLWVGGNPSYNRGNDEAKQRKRFLAHFRNITETSFQIQYLNGQIIEIDDRIQAKIHAERRHLYEDEDDAGATHLTTDKSAPVGAAVPRASASAAAGVASPPANRRSAGGPVKNVRGSVIGGFIPGQDKTIVLTPNTTLHNGAIALCMNPRENITHADQVFILAENARFNLAMHHLNYNDDSESVNLSNCKLKLMGSLELGISKYSHIKILDLQNNDFLNIEGQTLEMLPHLEMLDLRNNKLVALPAIIQALRGCNRLTTLYIQRSTRIEEETSRPSEYAPTVFADLRGIQQCDGVTNYNSIEKDLHARKAQEVLWRLAKIGPNNLKIVHLENHRLPSSLFYPVLAALNYLNVPELYAGGNNEWTLHNNYADVIILFMGKKFHRLDGVEIPEVRRGLAFKANKNNKLTMNQLKWQDVADQTLCDVDEWLEQEKARKQEEDKLVIKDQATDFNPNLPNMPKGNVNMNTNQQAANSGANQSIVSNVLNKLQIVVHYLQVYGLVLVMDVSIPFPQQWKDWSTYVRFSTFNFEDVWNMKLPYQQEIFFSIVMAVPALLFILFFYFNWLRTAQDVWADQYVTRWRSVKTRACCMWFFAVCGTTALCFAFVNRYETFDNFKNKKGPTPAGLTWACICFGVLTVWYFIWHKIVGVFRRHWLKDSTEDKTDFKGKWLNAINWAQIIILLLLTLLFMPLSRVILTQFACDCSSGTCINFNSDYTFDGNSTHYWLGSEDPESCFPDPVHPIQGVALFFAVVYIAGIPMFILYLIQQAIHTVLSTSPVYKMVNEKIDAISQPPEQATAEEKVALKKSLKELEEQRDTIYFQVVNSPLNVVPSTSIFGSFEITWRFWKLIQMFTNLSLVCISLFVPQEIGSIRYARVFLANFVICGSFLLALLARPYYDSFEDLMEIMASLANSITVLVALALMYEVSWLSQSQANGILFAANALAISSFVIALIVVPCKQYRKLKRIKKQEKDAEGRRQELQESKKTRVVNPDSIDVNKFGRQESKKNVDKFNAQQQKQDATNQIEMVTVHENGEEHKDQHEDEHEPGQQ